MGPIVRARRVRRRRQGLLRRRRCAIGWDGGQPAPGVEALGIEAEDGEAVHGPLVDAEDGAGREGAPADGDPAGGGDARETDRDGAVDAEGFFDAGLQDGETAHGLVRRDRGQVSGVDFLAEEGEHLRVAHQEVDEGLQRGAGGVGRSADGDDARGEDVVLGEAFRVLGVGAHPLLDHVRVGLEVGGAGGDGGLGGVEDVHGRLEAQALDERVGEQPVVGPGEVAHEGEVGGQEPLVLDRVADVAALVQEAEALAEGGLADDVEEEEGEPQGEVDGLGRRAEVVDAPPEERDAVVDEGFGAEDVGELVAPGEAFEEADAVAGAGDAHLVLEARVGESGDFVPGALE